MDLALLGADQEHVPDEELPQGADPRVGSSLGPYRILKCIGDGGMGRVYQAEHVHLERPVAIKFLLPRFAADAEAVSRFLEEAKTVNRVRHPNLIDIYDYFVEHDQQLVAYVMELLNGRSLREAMIQDTLGLARILPIARQICGALHAVHAVGIVHRDLKPENIYLCEAGEGEDLVKVLDFGVAKFTRGEVTHKTQEGMAMGSPWYMAPEQARGSSVDSRADVYSLGVILYELFTGRVPFPGDSYAAVLTGHLSKPPPPMRRRDGWVPPQALGRVVLRCLEKSPDERPPDMESAWQELLDAAGPQFAPPRSAPGGMRQGRTPRSSSRVTLPLAGSDPPIRLTPIEGATEITPNSNSSDSLLPVALSTPPKLEVAITPSPDLEVNVTPSMEEPPEPFTATVLGPSPLRRRRRLSLWTLAALGATLGFVGLTLLLTYGPAPTSPAGAAVQAAPPVAPVPAPASSPPQVSEAPTSEAPTSEAPTSAAAASVGEPPPAPRPEPSKPAPRAAPGKPPARAVSRPVNKVQTATKPRRPARTIAPKWPKPVPETPPRDSRNAILDPFR